jgi:hypothetical protein
LNFLSVDIDTDIQQNAAMVEQAAAALQSLQDQARAGMVGQRLEGRDGDGDLTGPTCVAATLEFERRVPSRSPDQPEAAMRAWCRAVLIGCFIAVLVGCSALAPSSAPTLGEGCVGSVLPPPAGLKPAEDPALLQSAQGAPGEGKLCGGRVFVATAAVPVYRVWDSARPHTLLGVWWSLSMPQGTRDEYRRANVICPGWSALDRVSACVLIPGTRVAIGPGQSARCDEGDTVTVLPASPVNQVYVPNNVGAGRAVVDACDAGAPWPSPSAQPASAR